MSVATFLKLSSAVESGTTGVVLSDEGPSLVFPELSSELLQADKLKSIRNKIEALLNEIDDS